jgi:hypothetical protein
MRSRGCTPTLFTELPSAYVFLETQRHEKRAGAVRPRLFSLLKLASS